MGVFWGTGRVGVPLKTAPTGQSRQITPRQCGESIGSPCGREHSFYWATGGGSCSGLREGPAATQAGDAQPGPPPAVLTGTPPAPRLPTGGKVVNTAPVPSQTPHDESDRRTEPRSSVSDLVNSLTSEMLMVRRAGAGRGGPGQG